MSNANKTQVAGSHYKHLGVQTWDFIHLNNIGYLAGNIIKYVVRYPLKNGLEDLKKARHYLDKLIEVTEEQERREAEESQREIIAARKGDGV